jgi:hypothetical protein
MGGVYGEIDSNVAYRRVLAEATDIARRILLRTPDNAMMRRIHKQLDAMKRWSDHGRKPTDIERRSIDVGLVAARELSGAPGGLGELVEKLFALNNYFEDWPTDEQAASATDLDFVDDDE